MAENIFLFVPNLVGYARIILMIMSFWCMQTNYYQATGYYLASNFLDTVDGIVARRLNQCTKFGHMLDMLTDRAANMGLLFMLGILYPSLAFWFQMSSCLDIVGHWLYMHSSIISGKSSHKTIDLSENPLLHIYYTNDMFLTVTCHGNEIFYCMVYLLRFTEGPNILFIGLFRIMVYLTAPIALLKSAISAVHLVTASINIGTIDVAEREELKQEKKE